MDFWGYMTASFLSLCFTQPGLILDPWRKTRWKHLKEREKGHRQEGSGCWGQILPTGFFSLGKTLRCCTKDIVLRIIWGNLRKCDFIPLTEAVPLLALVWGLQCVPFPQAWPFRSSLPVQSRNVSSSLMTPVHAPAGTRYLADISVINLAASIAALCCLPPGVSMKPDLGCTPLP